jgi:hypothetical protein
MRAYCFCCRALTNEEFQTLYIPPSESGVPGALSSKGKSAQDIFGECILCKNRGPKFVEEGGTELFHTEGELHEFFVWANMAANAHYDYANMGPEEPTNRWLLSMLSDEEAGWGADTLGKERFEELTDALPLPGPAPPLEEALTNMVEEADKAIGGWKSARSQVIVHKPDGGISRLTGTDGSLTLVPADQPMREGLVLNRQARGAKNVLILNRQVHHLGWSGCTANQFAALAGPAPPTSADDPSEVGPNA